MYHLSQVMNCSFDEAIARVTAALQQEGMGVLTEIDVQAAFKKKLGLDFRKYRILGACHPQSAYQMLQIDDKAGVFYPCNVVVQEHVDGRVEISAVDPAAMFASVQAPNAETLVVSLSNLMRSVMNQVAAVESSTPNT